MIPSKLGCWGRFLGTPASRNWKLKAEIGPGRQKDNDRGGFPGGATGIEAFLFRAALGERAILATAPVDGNNGTMPDNREGDAGVAELPVFFSPLLEVDFLAKSLSCSGVDK